jgi:hypothetical protein
MSIATYSFLPWARQGLGNHLKEDDFDPAVILRASVGIQLTLTGKNKSNDSEIIATVPRDIQLYGPGDIAGIDPRSIVKVEPRNLITNFEPNFLPYIEFYDEDFPWRYTPAKATGHKLRPWITLVVLKEDEFEDEKGAPLLPAIKLKKPSADIFPDAATLYFWAHVHVNNDLSNGAPPNGSNVEAVLTQLDKTLKSDPDQAYSRILCPRKLEANIGYHAFIIPTFESGRMTGLKMDLPSSLVATKSAWDGTQDIFPYYYRWYFRTGTLGDFEYLVNILKPKPADKKVGVRDMDVLHPGSNLPPIDTPVDINGVLKLGGALKVPYATLKQQDKDEVDNYDRWNKNPYPHPFETAIAKRINLADDYADPSKDIVNSNTEAGILIEKNPEDPSLNVADPDPVITSPLYGRWHALVNRILLERNLSPMPLAITSKWVHELNLDPRFRVAAGLGTKVIQTNQEEYMNAAWEQVGKIIEANNKILFTQLATEVSFFFFQKHVLPLRQDKLFQFTAPVHKRVVLQGLTVYKYVDDSTIPYAAVSAGFRTVIRPRGKLMKQLSFTRKITAGNILTRINNGEVQVVLPKTVPGGIIYLNSEADKIIPKLAPGFLIYAIRKIKWLQFFIWFIVFLLLVIIVFGGLSAIPAAVLTALAIVMIWIGVAMIILVPRIKMADSIKEENQTTAFVDELPKSPDFIISSPGENFKPATGNTDSEEAVRFKTALKDAYSFLQVPFDHPIKNKLDLKALNTRLKEKINPLLTIPSRAMTEIFIPAHIRENLEERFTPVMAYPEFDVPMYKPLSDISAELFLPNINLIEQNSITLLETNQRFIEAYMVGINHEMSRELLWREYPTDQRGSYFRQFWDVSGFLPPNPVPDNLKEALRDIPPIHKWLKSSYLGQHNNREKDGDASQLVLVIRGELLKRYPTAVIYAHKSDWARDSNGVADLGKERILVSLTPTEEKDPPRTKIKSPLFEAKLEPDIYFIGFDLNPLEAKGGTKASDDAGWYFVIKERPGEPRFGLDTGMEDPEPRLVNWNNLSWKSVGIADGKHITLTDISLQGGTDPNYEENKPDSEDVQARWAADSNAAELAYILYQVPVLVAVHASRMLPKNK